MFSASAPRVRLAVSPLLLLLCFAGTPRQANSQVLKAQILGSVLTPQGR